MGVGTMSDPEKAYDLEFVLESQNMANDLKKLINSFVDLSCKVVQRGKRYVCRLSVLLGTGDRFALDDAAFLW